MIHAKRWIAGAFLFLGLLLTGCGRTELSLPEGEVWLFSYGEGVDSDDRVVVMDSDGNHLLTLEGASVAACIQSDGKALRRTAGQIPEDGYLLVNLSQDGQRMSGVWSVAGQSWILGPFEGEASVYKNEISGEMFAFCLGEDAYDCKLQPLDAPDSGPFDPRTDEIFTLENGTVLVNAKASSGESCIFTKSGECYLNAEQFRTANGTVPFPMPQSKLRLEAVFEGKYLLIGGDYSGNSYGSYLCDESGNILYSEWDYEWVTVLRDSAGTSESLYLRFANTKSEFHYLNLTTGEELVIPEGLRITEYRYNDLFLLCGADKYVIYDAVSESFGASFAEADELTYMQILGMESYAFETDTSCVLVLGGQKQTLPDDTISFQFSQSNYSILDVYRMFSRAWSFILDEDGALVLKTKKPVIYAEPSYYVCLTGTGHYVLFRY